VKHILKYNEKIQVDFVKCKFLAAKWVAKMPKSSLSGIMVIYQNQACLWYCYF